MQLPKFRPSALAVNEPKQIRIDRFGKEFTKTFDGKDVTSILTEIVLDGQQMVWFLNKKTRDDNAHIMKEGGDFVCVRTLTDKGRDRIVYSAVGDISTNPRNIPAAQNPQLNTRQIRKNDEIINPARVGFSWNFAKDMLLAQKQGSWKDLKKELYVLASEIYHDEDVIKTFEKGFPKIKKEEKVSEASDEKLEDFPTDLPFE